MNRYYCHDINMRNNRKVSILRKRMGLSGYALWCLMLELLSGAEGYTIKWDDDEAELFTEEYDVEPEALATFLAFCEKHGMLIYNKECGTLTCPALLARVAEAKEKVEGLSAKRRKAAQERWAKEDDASECKPMQTDTNGCNTMQNSYLHKQTDANNDFVSVCNASECKPMQTDAINKDIDKDNNIAPKGALSNQRFDSPAPDACAREGDEAKEEKFLRGLVEEFNAEVDNHGSVMPKISRLGGDRRKTVKARIREHGIESIRAVIAKAACSDFLNGGNDRSFTATFDWLMKPRNFLKTLEGNYDNKPKPNYASNGTPTTTIISPSGAHGIADRDRAAAERAYSCARLVQSKLAAGGSTP